MSFPPQEKKTVGPLLRDENASLKAALNLRGGEKMGNRSSKAAWVALASRRGWFFILLGGLACIAAGCNPQALTMFAMPFTDPKTPPDYKLFADNKEVTLVILTSFAQQAMQVREEVRPAEMELPEHVADAFRKRCQANKHKLKIVPQTEVHNYLQKELISGELSEPVEIGAHFKADFVLDISIKKMSLYEPNSYPKILNGLTQIALTLYKVNVKEGEHKVYSKIDFSYTSSNPMFAEMDVATFRGGFLSKVARNISREFIAYDPEEKKIME
jgi:hypothetical protein